MKSNRALSVSAVTATVAAVVAAAAVTAAVLAVPSARPAAGIVAPRAATPVGQPVTPAAVTLASVTGPSWLPADAKQVARFQRGSIVHVGYSLPGAVNGPQTVPVGSSTLALGASGLSFDTSPYDSTALPALAAVDGITVTPLSILGQPARLVNASTGYGPFVLTWVSGGMIHNLTAYRWKTPLGVTGVTGDTLIQVAQSVPAGQ